MAVQVQTVTADFDSGLIFEQDPVQIIDALLPLYLNATLLRALQVPTSSPLGFAAAMRHARPLRGFPHRRCISHMCT